MKRLVFAVTGLLLVAALVLIGCAEEVVTPTPEVEAVSSCITCHSDKNLLKEVAAPPVEEEEPEEAAGEG